MNDSDGRPRASVVRSPRWLLVALLVGLAVVTAACGDDDDTGAAETGADGTAETGADGTAGESGSDPEAVSHTEMSPDELEVWQTDLNAVGCWAGPVDGELGSQTEAAIEAFQAAEGLTVDGLLGPVTEGALQDAAAAGETVCTNTTGGEDPPDDGEGAVAGAASATLSSASYGQTFTLGTCSVNADLSNISLRGEVNNLTLSVDATEGSGTVAVDGGTEGDGITLNGTIDTVEIGGDDSFNVAGTFGEPNNVGEAFTLTGACAAS